MVSIIHTVSSSGIAGLSTNPALTQRSTSSALKRRPVPL